MLAVAITGLLFLIFTPEEPATGQTPQEGDTAAQLPDTLAVIEDVPLEEVRSTVEDDTAAPGSAREGTEEATQTLQDLWQDFNEILPKLGIAVAILFIAWLLTRVLRSGIRRALHSWTRGNAVGAMVGIAIWLVAVGVALTVLTGDFRAFIGSVGLIGLALSWALQTPIESLTGWLLNSFHGYYRVGDRIAVGDVYGDVYRIDVLTTTLWEYGGPDRPGVHVRGEQATGRLITFPNHEILTGSVVNLTRDFPYVWDELQLRFAMTTDSEYLLATMQRIADEVVSEQMRGPARAYRELLQSQRLEPSIPDEPQVFLDIVEGQWLQSTVRYLVSARERRLWKSALVERVMSELRPEATEGRIHGPDQRHIVRVEEEDGTETT